MMIYSRHYIIRVNIPSDDFDTAEKDAENGVEERLDSKIEQGFDITNENVNHCGRRHCRNVPREDGRKDMEKHFDRVDSACCVCAKI